MNPSRAHLPFRMELTPAQRGLLLGCAAIVAVCLLSLYVHLLHESMARGEQMRAAQRSSANEGVAKSTGLHLPMGFMAARNAADSAEVRTR